MRQPIIVAGAMAAVWLAGCGRQQVSSSATSDPPPVSATVITVTTETLRSSIPVTGTLISNARVDVKAEVIGHIARFEKQEGDAVRAGEAVAWVDDENSQLAVRQAEAAVQVAEAGLERGRLLESHSRTELERAENLITSGGITDKDLKAAQLAGRDATAQVMLAQAQLEQARAALEMARKHVRDTIIYAPVSGEIQRKLVNKGSYVEAPTHVFTIVDNTRLELESPVASADIAPIEPGQRVTFMVNSYPNATFEGRVLEMNPAVDEQTRSAKVRIQVTNAGSKLKAGMFAQGEILTGVAANAVMIPAAALYRDDRSARTAFVFVLEGGKACRRAVRVGHEQESKIQVIEGLRQGEQLIAEQSIEISEGVRIEPRR